MSERIPCDGELYLGENQLCQESSCIYEGDICCRYCEKIEKCETSCSDIKGSGFNEQEPA
ncbi:hypothetical protein JCM15765_45670 [Paradesulfitobacterium aromaticivorans]